MAIDEIVTFSLRCALVLGAYAIARWIGLLV